MNQSACVSSKILHVQFHEDRKPRARQKLGGGRGGQIPYPGLDKFANAPPPGLRR